MNFYPFHIGDYAAHTRNLSLLEDLAYRRLLDAYYLAERPFNGCSTDVAREIGMRDQVAEVEYILGRFFERDGDLWCNKRADRVIAEYADKRKKASKAGAASAQRRLNGRSTSVGNGSTSVGNSHNGRSTNQEPITNNQEPINTKRGQAAPCIRPADVPEKVWGDFLAIRKAKRAPLTQTALDGIEAEASKAGITLADALGECCARGWQGFKAEWMAKAGQHPVGNKQERLEAANRQATAGWKPPELRHANG